MSVEAGYDAHVWIVWSEADYYGPHFQSVHATQRSADERAAALNDLNWPERPADHNWPFVVTREGLLP